MAHLADQITLDQHLGFEQHVHGWLPPLSTMISTMARASKTIAYGLSGAEITGMIGMAGHENTSGDNVQMLDMFAQETIEKFASASGLVRCMASEEVGGIIPVQKGYKAGMYALVFDPLDGSSNIDANITIGTIWGIRHAGGGDDSSVENVLQKSSGLQAAGYTMYGARTQFVYTAGHGVHIFTLDPISGEFVLTRRNVKMPTRGKVYSTNEGNTKNWSEGVKKYVQHLKDTDHVGRCSGAMIADFHRILLGGGIFFYPNPKLRLLYEAGPISFLAAEAGGMATDGVNNISNIMPANIHHKTPLIFGSREDVQEYLEITALQK
jgi:fructose-1,6-bisphosphatase I